MKTVAFLMFTAETFILQPRDRIHHICNELLTTEESYVERLNVLVKVNDPYQFIRGHSILTSTFYALCISREEVWRLIKFAIH